MNFEFHENTDLNQFNAFVEGSDLNTVFQSMPWAESKPNWDHMIVSVTENGEIRAAALVLIRKVAFGTSLWYIPRGPLMDYHNSELVSFFFENLKIMAKKKHCMDICFDPEVLYRRYLFSEKDKEHPVMNQDVIDHLRSIGAEHRGFTMHINDTIQPRFNAVMDLFPGYEETLSRKTRQSLRRAERMGTQIRIGHQYISQFAQAMSYTEERQGIALRNEEYFRNMAEAYGDHCIIMIAYLNFREQFQKLDEQIDTINAQLAEGKHSKKETNILKTNLNNAITEKEKLQKDYAREKKEEVILGGQLALYNDHVMELLYQGNNTDYLRLRSSYVMYEKCMDICVEKGIPKCSFGGVEGTLDDHLSQFKQNWPIHVEEYIGEFNVVLNRFMYSMVDDVYPKIRDFMVKLKHRKSDR